MWPQKGTKQAHLKQKGLKMKIIRDSQSGTLTLVAVEGDEEQVLTSIVQTLKPEDVLSYGGRDRDSENSEFCLIYLHAGSNEVPRIRRFRPGVEVHFKEHVGGVKMTLQGTTEADKSEVGRIRDMCYFGSSGLIFIGETQVDGKKSIITTGLRCKHCGIGMVEYHECEWKTCDACATKCDHNYVRGAIHGGGVGIGVGYYCDKCGRGKPKTEGEREKSVIEQHLAVEEELGMRVLYKDGFPNTPRQVVKIRRLARRLEKARRQKSPA